MFVYIVYAIGFCFLTLLTLQAMTTYRLHHKKRCISWQCTVVLRQHKNSASLSATNNEFDWILLKYFDLLLFISTILTFKCWCKVEETFVAFYMLLISMTRTLLNHNTSKQWEGRGFKLYLCTLVCLKNVHSLLE